MTSWPGVRAFPLPSALISSEQVGFFPSEDSRLQTGFTNLPRARLYGGEVEVQKYIALDGFGSGFETPGSR